VSIELNKLFYSLNNRFLLFTLLSYTQTINSCCLWYLECIVISVWVCAQHRGYTYAYTYI